MRIYRHTLPVRIGHWINVLCLPILIMSGLQIFNAHPALYWGDRSDRDRPLLVMRAVTTESGERKGITTVLGHPFDTTGLLGYSSEMRRGFPSWATLPGPQWLAMGRRWHLFFAWFFVINGLIFGLYAILSRHLPISHGEKLAEMKALVTSFTVALKEAREKEAASAAAASSFGEMLEKKSHEVDAIQSQLTALEGTISNERDVRLSEVQGILASAAASESSLRDQLAAIRTKYDCLEERQQKEDARAREHAAALQVSSFLHDSYTHSLVGEIHCAMSIEMVFDQVF